MSININFAKHFEIIRLINVFDYVIGGDWGKDPNLNLPEFGHALCIRGSEFKNWQSDKGKTASLRSVKLNNIRSRKLQEGDILIEISGGGPEQPVGRTVLIDQQVIFHQPEVPKICTNFLRLARPTKHISSHYIQFYLKFFYHTGEVVKYQGGSNNLRNLKFDDYVSIDFPLPPLAEQQRIVAKIEELFSELDKGIETLKTAQQQLKVYRQAVLKYAFESLHSEETIEQITDNSMIGIVRSNSELVSDKIGVPYIKMNNVDMNGKVNYNKMVFVSVNSDEQKKYCLFEGDILINTRNSFELVGKTGYVSNPPTNAVYNNNLLRIRLKQDYNAKFVCLQMNSPWFRKQMVAEKKATTNVCALYQRDIFPLKIKTCDLKHQNLIVQEIESRLSVCDKIEESIEQGLQQAEALRQSILKKAFEGKLVPQDPSDEPASVLLDRIKAARAGQTATKKSQTKKDKV